MAQETLTNETPSMTRTRLNRMLKELYTIVAIGVVKTPQDQILSAIPPPFEPLPLELPEELRFQLELSGLY